MTASTLETILKDGKLHTADVPAFFNALRKENGEIALAGDGLAAGRVEALSRKDMAKGALSPGPPSDRAFYGAIFEVRKDGKTVHEFMTFETPLFWLLQQFVKAMAADRQVNDRERLIANGAHVRAAIDAIQNACLEDHRCPATPAINSYTFEQLAAGRVKPLPLG